jgi:hypothetical protein
LSNTDVLVLTADDVEMAALEDVINREAVSVAPSVDGSGFRIIRATMVDDQGHEFAVIAARAHTIGGASAANAATRLVTQYKPYCLAMCGIRGGWSEASIRPPQILNVQPAMVVFVPVPAASGPAQGGVTP